LPHITQHRRHDLRRRRIPNAITPPGRASITESECLGVQVPKLQHPLSAIDVQIHDFIFRILRASHEFSDPQIASRFEQMELPIWTESDELRRFVAGYLAMLPIRKNPAAIDQRFIEYVLALTDGVTGRIIDLLRRAAVDALGHKSKSVGIDQLLMAGAHLPAIINQRTEFPI
jgi:hypothetical protein